MITSHSMCNPPR